jgi:hypothetical protein
MRHSQRLAETLEEIIRLARKISNSDAVVFTPNIPENEKRKYINMPDGTIVTRRDTYRIRVKQTVLERFKKQ